MARPKELLGGGGMAATAEMVDLFPMADGKKPGESVFEYDELKFYTYQIQEYLQKLAGKISKTGVSAASFGGDIAFRHTFCLKAVM